MPSFFKSNKGMETAPLFIIFSAVVILLAATMILPELGKWNASIDKTKTLREAERIQAACDEIMKMGDTGTVEEINVDVPKDCCVGFNDADGSHITASCSMPNQEYYYQGMTTVGDLNINKIKGGWINGKYNDGYICSTSVKLIIAYWNGEDKNVPQGSYIIYVKKPAK